jgi:hypothetical protein
MQPAKRYSSLEQLPDKEVDGCAKPLPGLVLADLGGDQLSAITPAENSSSEQSRVSPYWQWYAYIM